MIFVQWVLGFSCFYCEESYAYIIDRLCAEVERWSEDSVALLLLAEVGAVFNELVKTRGRPNAPSFFLS